MPTCIAFSVSLHLEPATHCTPGTVLYVVVWCVHRCMWSSSLSGGGEHTYDAPRAAVRKIWSGHSPAPSFNERITVLEKKNILKPMLFFRDFVRVLLVILSEPLGVIFLLVILSTD